MTASDPIFEEPQVLLEVIYTFGSIAYRKLLQKPKVPTHHQEHCTIPNTHTPQGTYLTCSETVRVSIDDKHCQTFRDSYKLRFLFELYVVI